MLPSFIIILIIAAVLTNLLKYAGVRSFLEGIRPCIVAMILTTALTMGLSVLTNVQNVESKVQVNFRGFVILFVIVLVQFWSQKWRKKEVSPVLLIILSAFLGVVLYS